MSAKEQSSPSKPRLLVLELWGLGDLVLASPFLQAAVKEYEVTLLAKPYAEELRKLFWPEVQVVPFSAPWTAFRGKYRLWNWPWRQIRHLRRELRQGFDFGVSARWDPRDHLFLRALHVRRALGFPRLGSRVFLAQSLARPGLAAHRYDYWRRLGQSLNLQLPSREDWRPAHSPAGREIVVHTGAGQAVRVWPLPNYRKLVDRLREKKYVVRVACDASQRDWWLDAGEREVATPRRVSDLLELCQRAGVFIGNDSGPSHLAGFYGVPTFTLFGPQLPQLFSPLHPAAEWSEGEPCIHKPCSDYCRFPQPFCLVNTTEMKIWSRVESFVQRRLG